MFGLPTFLKDFDHTKKPTKKKEKVRDVFDMNDTSWIATEKIDRESDIEKPIIMPRIDAEPSTLTTDQQRALYNRTKKSIGSSAPDVGNIRVPKKVSEGEKLFNPSSAYIRHSIECPELWTFF